jgi:hypothetical protein
LKTFYGRNFDPTFRIDWFQLAHISQQIDSLRLKKLTGMFILRFPSQEIAGATRTREVRQKDRPKTNSTKRVNRFTIA